ncbi:MAG: rolling circle replication-associated protein [Paracoccaceae bacterium]
MAEKTEHRYAFCLALTYSDDTQEARDAAEFFNYGHVRSFLARVRAAVRRKDEGAQVRFIVAGEQGDMHRRCHWHIILYSDVDLRSIGDLEGFAKTKRGAWAKRALHWPADAEFIMTADKRERRLSWSMWEFGFVTFQEPDEKGMAYVLSYCLKDQFTMEKSLNTGRAANAENFATGMFRMSKYPPIGEAFIWKKLAALADAGQCLPSLMITVPGFRGKWQPSGSLRKKLLWALVALNQRSVWTKGANAPQWSSLLLSCKGNEADMEILNGEKKVEDLEKYFRRYVETWAENVAFREQHFTANSASWAFARRCAARAPCLGCRNILTEGQLGSIGVVRGENDKGQWVYWWADNGLPVIDDCGSIHAEGPNAYCALRDSDQARSAFPPDRDRD